MNRENKSIVLNRNNTNRTIIKLEARLRNFIGKNISISISTTYNNFEVMKRICFFLYKISSLYHWIDRRYRSISKNLAMYIFVQRRDKNYFAPDILIRFQHSNFKKRVHEFAQLSKTFEKKKEKWIIRIRIWIISFTSERARPVLESGGKLDPTGDRMRFRSCTIVFVPCPGCVLVSN